MNKKINKKMCEKCEKCLPAYKSNILFNDNIDEMKITIKRLILENKCLSDYIENIVSTVAPIQVLKIENDIRNENFKNMKERNK